MAGLVPAISIYETPSPPKRDRRDEAPRAQVRGDPDEPGDDELRGFELSNFP